MKSNFRRNNKSSTPLFGLFIFAICLYLIIISPNIFNFTRCDYLTTVHSFDWFVWLQKHFSDTSCPIEGPKSSAPLNHFEFIANVERSIKVYALSDVALKCMIPYLTFSDASKTASEWLSCDHHICKQWSCKVQFTIIHRELPISGAVNKISLSFLPRLFCVYEM